MLIIVEGVDGSGKTTFVNELSHWLEDDVHIRHAGPPTRHPMEEYELPLVHYTGTDNIICDRWHMGELIYGPLYRGASSLTTAMHTHVELLLARLGATKILMDTPFHIVQQRLQERGEDFLQPQHYRLVYDAYDERCDESWRRVGPRLRAPIVIEQAQSDTRAVEHLQDHRTYVGPITPKALILGDRRGTPKPGRPHYPWAFVPYQDTSGHFLLTSLVAAGATGYGIANSWEENLPLLWENLKRPKVVLLGREAERRVNMVFTPNDDFMSAITARLEHPQYVRRFKAGALHEYGRRIKEGIDG